MRAIRRILVIVLVLLIGGQIATNTYLRSQNRTDPPVISCPSGVLEVSALDKKSVLLTDVKAIDPQDGDITDRIILGGVSQLISEDVAKVTLMVFDSDNNMGKCTRLIRYRDYHRPRFSIISPLVCTTAEEISLSTRLTATDVLDGDISDRIGINMLTSTENPEIFFITVHVSNSVRDIATLQLPVLMQTHNPQRPEIKLLNYLTYVEKGSEVDLQGNILSVWNLDGDATVADVTIDGTVDTNKEGTYHVFYSYSDANGVGMATLTVVVQ